MKVRVRFFASVAEQLGSAAEDIELPSGVRTVADLRAHLTVIERNLHRAVGENTLVDGQAIAATRDRVGLPRQVLPQREVHRLLVVPDKNSPS